MSYRARLGLIAFLSALAFAPNASGTAHYGAHIDTVLNPFNFPPPGVELLNGQFAVAASANQSSVSGQLSAFAQDGVFPWPFAQGHAFIIEEAGGFIHLVAEVTGDISGGTPSAISSASSTMTFDLHNLTSETIEVTINLHSSLSVLGTVDDPTSELVRIELTAAFTAGDQASFQMIINRLAPPNFSDFTPGFFPLLFSSTLEIGPDGTVPVSWQVTAFGLAQAIPAPTPLVLISVGIAALVVRRWRRQQL